MTKDEGLKLALEALEGVLDNSPKVLDASISGGLYEVVQCREAITAIKEALAQPEQEPVKYSDYEPDGVHHNKPQQEPVAYWKEHAQGLQRDYDSLLADFQAQRSESSGKPSAWVGLTDEEYTHITDTVFHTGQGLVAYYKAIEAKLREKNSQHKEKNT